MRGPDKTTSDAGEPGAGAADAGRPAVARRRLGTACAALLVVEVIGMAFMWAAVPFAWIWVGKRVGAATLSLTAALGVAFFGFVATAVATAWALQRLDDLWIRMRRRAGHEQSNGALSQVVVVSTLVGLLAFFTWYYVLSRAFIIPFMPSH